MRSVVTNRLLSVLLPGLTAGLIVGCDVRDERSAAQPQEREDTIAEQPAAGGPAEATARETGEGAEIQPGAITRSFPSEDNALIRIEQQIPNQVRVGEPFSYTIHVANVSEHPVHDLVLREHVSGAMEIASVQMGQRQQQQAQQAKGQEEQAHGAPGAEQGQQQDVQEPQGAPADESQQQRGQQRSQAARQGGAENEESATTAQRQKQQQAQGAGPWRLGTLMPGEKRTIHVTAAPLQEGQAKTCLTVDYKPSLCSEVTVVQPELRLERWIVDEEGQRVNELYACDSATLIYRLTNTGSGTTTKVRIQEQLPKWVETPEQQDVNLVVEPLSAGESVVKRVPIQFTQAGEFSGRALAYTDKLKVQSRQSGLRILQPQIQLTVDGPGQTYLGRTAQYTVTVSNPGSAPAPETRVRLNIPENIERISFSSQQVRREGNQFVLGTLAPGESRSFTVSFDPAAIGTVALKAQAQAYCAPARAAQVATRVIGVPAVRLEVFDLKDPVPVGEETTYAIRVKNQGSAEDLNINLEARLPQEMEFVAAEGDTDVRRRGDDTLRFGTVGELAPGELVEWRVRARAVDPNRVKFQVDLSSDATRETVSEAEPTTLY